MRANEFIKPKQRKTKGTANNNLSPSSLAKETPKPMTANELAAAGSRVDEGPIWDKTKKLAGTAALGGALALGAAGAAQAQTPAEKATYLQQRPDVAKAGVDAWDHYRNVGYKEKMSWPRDGSEPEPSQAEKNEYYKMRPDVAKAGMDAWDHYRAWGKKEGMKWPSMGSVNQSAPSAPVSPATPSSGMSDYTVKGLKFGMGLADVVNITKSTVRDWSDPRTQTITTKPATHWNEVTTTVGGIQFHAIPSKDGKMLDGLQSFPRSEYVGLALETFSKQYGNPTHYRQYKAKTKGGIELDCFEARWQVKDAVITMYNHIDRDKGSIEIVSKNKKDTDDRESANTREKEKSDF